MNMKLDYGSMTLAQRTFDDVYRENLRWAIANHPSEYGFPVSQANEVADRMINAIGVTGIFNHDSRTFKLTAKALGIKPTRKALLAYWNTPNSVTMPRPLRLCNDFKPEVTDLLASLEAAGCTLVEGDNGEDAFSFAGDVAKFVEELTACDEARLYVRVLGGVSKFQLYLVLGNCPGELVCDYSVNDVLDKVTEAHYDKWSKLPQPTISK